MTEEQRKVYEALMAFHREHMPKKNFSGRELVEHMEPVFREVGCRKLPEPGARTKILTLRDDAAGDFVLNSAFQRELRRIYPASHITLFASTRNIEVARCCPYVDNIIINDIDYGGSTAFWDVFAAAAKYATEVLLPYHFDLGFSGRLGIRSVDVLLLYMSGARNRVCFTQDRSAGQGKIARLGWDVMMTVILPIRDRIESDAERDLFMLEGMLQLPIANRSLEMWLLDTDRQAAEKALEPLRREKKLKRIYAVMPGASEAFKEWPVERFAELLKVIMKREKDLGLAILGGEKDKKRAETLAALFPRRAISLAGKLAFRESAALLSLCEKYIGNDTGLMHMAAAQKVPVLTLFPYPASLGLFPMSCPVRFQPYGVPAVAVLPAQPAGEKCHLNSGTGCAVKEAPHCILGVTVEKMLQGYKLLGDCIRENRKNAVLLK